MAGSLRFGGRDYANSVTISMKEMMMAEKVYVAVTGKYLENRSSLVWAINNTGGKEFCIVYVQSIHISALKMIKKKAKAHKNLDKYLHICSHMQVTAEKVYIEMESVEKGLIKLITERGVKKLVMGAVADRHYSTKVRDLQSKKAIYIRNEAPETCHIWFTCKGYLICSREARRRDNLYIESGQSSSVSQSEITTGTTSVPSSSMIRDDDQIRVAVKEAEDLKKTARFEASKRKEAARFEASKRKEAAHFEASKRKEAARFEASKRKEAEEVARFEASKRKEAVEAARFEASKRKEAEEAARFEASKRKEAEEAARFDLYMCKEDARFEVSLRKDAVKAAKDAINKAEQSESLYVEEWNHRRETEEALNEAIEQLDKTRSGSEKRIEKCNKVIRKLQGKYCLLREKQEELQTELRLSKLKSNHEEEEASSSSTNREPPQYFICPITQDVMEDPYVAADGFTYEREAISGWFDRGHVTSPMTNKRFPHTSLVANRALRSAIKEWHQTSGS